MALRTAVGTRWWLRRSTVLALALFVVKCTARDERPHPGGSAGSMDLDGEAGAGSNGGSTDVEGEAGAGSSGGSTDLDGEAGAGAGGVAGRDGSTSEGGSRAGNADGNAGSQPHSDPDPALTDPEPNAPDRPEPPAGLAGLPCEVEAMLRTRCQSCHSSHPVDGALVSLVTYADLTAKSKSDPSVSVAARCLKRINASVAPMPPAPASRATSAAIAALQAWLEAGTPPSACDPPDEPGDSGSGGEGGQPVASPDPYDVLPICTSDSYWPVSTAGSPWMMPGRACITCHLTTNGHGPRFTIAGTVYPTAHEPDRCYGVPATTGAVVIITDANGVELPPVTAHAGGNFNALLNGLALPYRAKVVVRGNARVMLTPQTNGDCNACHTQDGAQGARGRIILP